MFDQHFLSPAATADVFGPLQGGERVMWRGRCGVAEYAFDEAASLPRWTLPETTDVLVTDHRVLYAYTAEDGHQVRSGELRWLWPQHLRVQPGARSTDRGAAATQIQLVCGGADGTYPALVFAGGELATVGDADRLANVIRQAIARFRVDNIDKLGLTAEPGPDAVPPADRPGVPQPPGRRRPDRVAARRDAGQPAGAAPAADIEPLAARR